MSVPSVPALKPPVSAQQFDGPGAGQAQKNDKSAVEIALEKSLREVFGDIYLAPEENRLLRALELISPMLPDREAFASVAKKCQDLRPQAVSQIENAPNLIFLSSLRSLSNSQPCQSPEMIIYQALCACRSLCPDTAMVEYAAQNLQPTEFLHGGTARGILFQLRNYDCLAQLKEENALAKK